MESGSASDSSSTGTEECDFSESFDVPDGSPWPSPWVTSGGVALADVQGGRGRLVSQISNYSLSRMLAPVNCTDVEVTLSFEFTTNTQGIGIYVRANGGYLQQTNPVGEGYAGFVELFREPTGTGVWREVNGIEQIIGSTTPLPVEAGVPYRARLRVTQRTPDETLLQMRFWRDGDSEPGEWQAENVDSHPPLQGQPGQLAIDAWTSLQSGEAPVMFVDDIVVTPAG